MANSLGTYVIASYVLLVLVAGWLYFRRYQMVRPPIGVMSAGDVAFMIVGIILIPYLYIWLPNWLLAGLLLLASGSTLYFVWEPVIRRKWALWLITVALAATELTLVWRYTTHSALFLAFHNVLLLMQAVGIANLWAQSGMKARDAALLGIALALYDFVFTSQLSLMTDLFARVAELPFAPLVAWPLGSDGQWIGIGLGDLLLATVFPLVMRKAFGRSAGWVALAAAFAAITIILLLPSLGMTITLFPVMVVLGPLMALQYLYWRRHCGCERTTWQYLRAEPLPHQ